MEYSRHFYVHGEYQWLFEIYISLCIKGILSCMASLNQQLMKEACNFVSSCVLVELLFLVTCAIRDKHDSLPVMLMNPV